MKFNTGPIKSWFGFDRRERRSSFILFIIILVVIVIRFAVPATRDRVENISEQFSYAGTGVTMKPHKVMNTLHSDAVKDSIRKNVRQHSAKKPVSIDLNSCDSAMLVKLPGIGPVLSVRIIKFRNLLGGFANVEQLKEVYGLPEETYQIIRERVYADTLHISRIRINTAEYKELSHIYYLGKFEIAAIIKYRDLKGRINCIGDLTENKLISKDKANKIRLYLSFE